MDLSVYHHVLVIYFWVWSIKHNLQKSADIWIQMLLEWPNSIALYRLEEKLSNMESENQVLRQQTLVLSPTKGLSNRFKSTVFQVGETTLDVFYWVYRDTVFVQEGGYFWTSNKSSFLITEWTSHLLKMERMYCHGQIGLRDLSDIVHFVTCKFQRTPDNAYHANGDSHKETRTVPVSSSWLNLNVLESDTLSACPSFLRQHHLIIQGGHLLISLESTDVVELPMPSQSAQK